MSDETRPLGPADDPGRSQPPGDVDSTAGASPDRRSASHAATPPPPPQDQSSRSRQFWLLPVAAFVIGCILGGVLVGVAQTGSGGSAADGTQAAPSPTVPVDGTTGDADLEVRATVPAECLEAVDLATSSFDTLDRGLAALQDFDTATLRDVFGELQEVQPELSQLAARCRDEAELPTFTGSTVTEPSTTEPSTTEPSTTEPS